jgi:hypothetical protein
MKLQRSPLILLLIALSLGGFVYFFEAQKSAQQEASQAKIEQKLFPFEEAEVTTVDIATSTQTLSFIKSSAANVEPTPKSPQPQAKKPVWLMIAPKKTSANDGTIAFLLNLMATGKSQESFTVPVAKLEEFGLDQPATIVTKLTNQQTHRLLLGKANFNRSGVYAQVNPPTDQTGKVAVVLVAMDFENAINRSITEWQQPDAQPKPAPSTNQPATTEQSPQPQPSVQKPN